MDKSQLYTNMLSITRITASRAILIVPKAAVSSGISTRFFSLASDLQSKVRQRVRFHELVMIKFGYGLFS
jgi:hypothetical protein